MNGNLDNIAIIGAGAWGTALAQVLAQAGRGVTLYARSAHLAQHINEERRNLLYLPDVALHGGIRCVHDLEAAARGAGLVLLATPAQYARATLRALKPLLPPGAPLVNVAKGIEVATGKLLSEVAAEEAPGHPYAALSGPTFAHEVAAGLPAAVTLATTHPGGAAWAAALRGRSFRPYLSGDPVGADTGGAIKNVIALACGIVEGRLLGQNARAAVMTRGMAEMRRLGVARGARSDTFLGLSGLGDLTLTCNSMSSRNFSLGAALGRGERLEDILSARRTVAEGVATARAVAGNAETYGVEMPICLAVDHILHGGGDIDDIIEGLLSRGLKSETV